MAEGAGGFVIARPDRIARASLAALIDAVTGGAPKPLLFADLRGAPRAALRPLEGLAFTGTIGSAAHWDARAPWAAEEYAQLRAIAPPLAAFDAGADPLTLTTAAGIAHGLIAPLERAGDPHLARAIALMRAAAPFDGALRTIAFGNGATVIARGDAPDLREAGRLMLLLVNRGAAPAALRDADLLGALGLDLESLKPVETRGPPLAPLAPGEVRALTARRGKPIAAKTVGTAKAARAAAAAPRLAIEAITPAVDGGAYPVKACVGDELIVEADLFGDGHELYAAELRWRALDEKSWRAVRMAPLGNDRWQAALPLVRLGRHDYVIEGWLDRFGGFRRDFKKKLDAGVAQPVDAQEGRALVVVAARRHKASLAERLAGFVARLDAAADDPAESAALLLDPELALLMDEADDRPFALASPPIPVDAERREARFSSWYELFPRSQTDDPARHGTFDDVIARLPQIREMGFDTLYFTPIHPIGRTHRKGPNNSLTAGPGDPGSPYAIGSDEGGHDALHPELGTPADFRRMVAAARAHGLEIALDFAIQCSPDHPWLKEHPGWFDWRPDGTIKYAENPPKKYQDIVNVDFYRPDAVPDLWVALRDVVLHWIGEGVKTFRVDNPHTKPFAFWEWMIGDIRRVHPDVIFLSEAFTRPKVMYRLAKIGFSQSYTYFTWRNEKQELIEYLTELTTTAPKDFFRPHFFVNTPDINPVFLHDSGPAGFKIRAALAATLSGLFGVYSGFELCESRPVPGKEEYWESEKYEVKPRDWEAPGNIIADITLLNRLRRAYPALQTHLGVSFYTIWNDRILYFGKPSPDGAEKILVAVSLDPHQPQAGDFEIPLWEWGLGDHEALEVEDLVGGAQFAWHGKIQSVRLTPDQPYAIWRVAPPGGPA